MLKPSYEELLKYKDRGDIKLLPVMKEILSDFTSPIICLEKLKRISPRVFLLESAEKHEKRGRYTFIGYEPKECIRLKNGLLHFLNSNKKVECDNPVKYLRELMREYRSERLRGFPSFTGGLVGYFAYDYIRYMEPCLGMGEKDDGDFDDLELMLFDKLVVFDHYRHRILLISNVRIADGEDAYHKAALEVEEMESLITESERVKDTPCRLSSELKPLFSRTEFTAMVDSAKRHIKEGDIFQIVLSNRLEADYEGSLLKPYRMLRCINPSPYMFYLSEPGMELMGASPETLVKLEDGVLKTFPLAGTRARGKTEEEDRALGVELLADEKELAEHNMLVDLGRNDIGRISRFGTVRVEKLHELIRYSHVMHIGSSITGDIRADKDAWDAVGAVLPAGTLSGAPKIKACQLIQELEGSKRGVYGGGIGYLDFNGNLDLCIAIRIAYKKGDKVYVRAGAGIVADSLPEREYEECMNKAGAVAEALRQAEQGEESFR